MWETHQSVINTTELELKLFSSGKVTMGEQKVKKVSEEEMLAEADKQLEMIKKVKEGMTEKNEKPAVAKTQKEPQVLEQSSVRGKQKRKSSAVLRDEQSKSFGDLASAKKHSKSTSKKTKVDKKLKKPKVRSKKYQEAKKLVDVTKKYSIDEAIELVKKTAFTKFDSSVEAHYRLTAKKAGKGKRIEIIRGLIEMPYSTGKKIKVAVLDDVLIKKIQKDKSTDFDVLLATPEMMPKIARLAKILGPSGKMPNPKSGTITTDPKVTMKKIQSGRIEYKSDKSGIIHMMIGKVSYDKQKLIDNYKALLAKIGKDKLQSITICATMGPSVKIEF